MKKVYIAAATRTPIGSYLGTLSNFSAIQLGSIVLQNIIHQHKLPTDAIQEVILGNVLQAGLGQSPARQVALNAGLSTKIICTTINKVCASGMKAVMYAAQSIALGDAEMIIAGGMESMSNVPHYQQMRKGVKYGNITLVDGLAFDGLTDPYEKCPMGIFADKTAEKYSISREMQDAFAISSYQRAKKSWDTGKFRNEISPVEVIKPKGNSILFEEDEEYKQVLFDKIPLLRPAFSPNGTVTAANASTMNDGAAALLIVSEEALHKYKLSPLAEIVSYADVAQEPENFTTAPALAIPKALDKAHLTLADIDYFEFNEAFSVVGLVNTQLLNLTPEKVNVNGGAVALGHPLGCSGARILVSLVHILHQNQATYGAAAICNGGGGASATIIKKI